MCTYLHLQGAKLKVCAIVSGASRHLDWNTALADHLVMALTRPVIKGNETAWLLPFLKDASTPARLLGDYIRDMLPLDRGGSKDYEGYEVPSLPFRPSAAGLRRGACNQLARWLPAELAVHLTGHDLKFLSALWEYLDADITISVACAIILVGHKPFQYGQLGEAPHPPSMAALVGVTDEALQVPPPPSSSACTLYRHPCQSCTHPC